MSCERGCTDCTCQVEIDEQPQKVEEGIGDVGQEEKVVFRQYTTIEGGFWVNDGCGRATEVCSWAELGLGERNRYLPSAHVCTKEGKKGKDGREAWCGAKSYTLRGLIVRNLRSIQASE